ncbi:MAG: HAMP domain-containing histidine kinase [Alphaproteobacteria bacterium]|nr:HAMP domain-containing histidine kinase [Alphaproteobacteria bacterium]
MRRGSIALNVFVFSALWLVAALAATAFLLGELYLRALDASLGETLNFQIESLVNVALDQGPGGAQGVALGDPRFQRPGSGWYWQIAEAESGVPVAFSTSLVGSRLPENGGVPTLGGRVTATVTDDYGILVRITTRRLALSDTQYDFTVTGNLDEIYELVDDFRGQAITVLGAVGAMLAVMSALVARFALRPVTRLRQALEDVREGETQSVSGAYPAELAPLADEINQLLHSNAEIIERARNQVGNLAHGLKTPLAVLRNEAEGERTALARIVADQTTKMSEIVSTYLDRARLAARTAIVGKRADTAMVLTRLVRVMTKIHPDRKVVLTLPDRQVPWFRGEEADLEEMTGNLIDNACKWARSEVRVLARTATGGTGLEIRIEDDGPGLGETERAAVKKRGVRLDEKTPGSGLGLDIVMELAKVYGGALDLERAASGGLSAVLTLPAARQR